MTQSPLHLNDYFFTKFNLDSKCGPFEEKEIYPVQTKLDVKKGKRNEWIVYLGIRKGAQEKTENKCYVFEIEMMGIFECDKEEVARKGLEEEKLVRINGPSLLYGAAREMLFALTARGPWTAYMLPSVSFMDEGNSKKDETPKKTRRKKSK